MKFTSGLKHRNNTCFANFVVKRGNIEYNQSILSQGNTEERRTKPMNNAYLVRRLVELLLDKEKDKKQVALAQDQSQNDTKKQDDKRQKKAQLAKG